MSLASLNNSELGDLQKDLTNVPGGVIEHPFGYYRIPIFASNLTEVVSKVPIRLVDDGDEMWKKGEVFGHFDGTSACIKTSEFDLRNRILTVVCGNWEQVAVEQAIEHEIRHGLVTYLMNLYKRSMDEGFALTTYSGYHGVKDTKDWETDSGFWVNVLLAAQERGMDDLKLITNLSELLEPKSYPPDELEEYKQGHRAAMKIVENVGADKPTDKFLLQQRQKWQDYRHRVCEIVKKKLESAGGLKLKTAEEIAADYI